MSKLYALVEANEIKKINIRLPYSTKDYSISANATDDFLATLNIYPISGGAPAYDPATQRCNGPSYTFNGVAVVRGYTVADIPLGELATKAREAAKKSRTAAVEAITVTTTTGKVFDGHPQALQNLTSAYVVGTASNIATTPWTLADNSRVEVTLAEIKEAMTLSGLEVSRLWALL